MTLDEADALLGAAATQAARALAEDAPDLTDTDRAACAALLRGHTPPAPSADVA